ncbi:hypothetical protein B0H14DRAFT_3653166 [Mycena olivaceomarginata]|nr:hypothetical protein B0H14DRAFT_3653166 [Mycena olivaceomarginata]
MSLLVMDIPSQPTPSTVTNGLSLYAITGIAPYGYGLEAQIDPCLTTALLSLPPSRDFNATLLRLGSNASRPRNPSAGGKQIYAAERTCISGSGMPSLQRTSFRFDLRNAGHLEPGGASIPKSAKTRLRRYQFYVFHSSSGLHYLPYVPLFLGPHLQTLAFGSIFTSAHLALVPKLPARWPMLTNLFLDVTPGLDLRFWEPIAIHELGHLRDLVLLAIECLRLVEEPEFIPTWVAIPGTRKFPRLREVTFECASPRFIVAFMNMKDTEALYATLAAKCDHPTLAELTLHTSSAAHMAMPPTLLAAPRWSPSLR